MGDGRSLREVDFQNYKAFGHYKLHLQRTNVLVGPNNCGKSTVIGVLRTLATGMRLARAKSATSVVAPGEQRFGYQIAPESMPISLENVHTDYADSDTLVTFRFDNGNSLELYFPVEGGCNLLTRVTGRPVRRPAEFRHAFPFQIAVVPVLGPIEHRERLLSPDTVMQHLQTHRASRHFRNYWHLNSEGFDAFADLVQRTWPGMTIQRPRLENVDPTEVFMFVQEHRIPRELFWCGFGFQVWCQLLTHISRNQNADMLVVDEPEVYLHPDLQRRLLGLLKGAGPATVLASHSTELMADADPADIVLIDKSDTRSRRLKDVDAVQAALGRIGSIHNITLVQLARSRRVLYVENTDDFKLLRRLALGLGLRSIADGAAVTAISSGGFGSWREIGALAKRIKEATGTTFRIAAVYDRDYRSAEEIEQIVGALAHDLMVVRVLERKEIENYLLIPSALDRLIYSLALSRTGSTALTDESEVDSAGHLARITDGLRHEVLGQYAARRQDHYRAQGQLKQDNSVATREASEWLERQWSCLDNRLAVVPGKKVLAAFRAAIQDAHNVTFTDMNIAQALRKHEIPDDMQCLLADLNAFCTDGTTNEVE